MNLDHELWLERNRPTSSDRTRWEGRVRGLEYQPAFSVIVLAPPERRGLLDDTIRSVSAQIYPRHDMAVVAGVAAANDELRKSPGEFSIFLEAGDILAPEALACIAASLHDPAHADAVYSDHDSISPLGIRHSPFFKPQWSPDLLMSLDYIGRACAIRTSLLREVEGLRDGFAAAVFHDLMLRVAERTSRILHVPCLLFSLREDPAQPSGEALAQDAGKRAVEEAVRRRGHPAVVSCVKDGGYHVRYKMTGCPKLTIIIPTDDRMQLLHGCLEGLRRHTPYDRIRIVIVDGSRARCGHHFLRTLGASVRILPFDGTFHPAAMGNWAARHSVGDYLLFLSNESEIASGWLDDLMGLVQRPEVGAVGPRIVDQKGVIQQQGWSYWNEGSLLNFHGAPENARSYFNLANLTRDCTAVSGGFLLISRRMFERVGGFDEGYQSAYGDLDLCLKLRRRGQWVVCNPSARVVNHHDEAQGGPLSGVDGRRLRKEWMFRCAPCDPFFNPNLTSRRSDFVPKADVSLRRESRSSRSGPRHALVGGVPRIRACPKEVERGEESSAGVLICDLARVPTRVWIGSVAWGAILLFLPAGLWLWEHSGLDGWNLGSALGLGAAIAVGLSFGVVEGILRRHVAAHAGAGPYSYRHFLWGVGFHDLVWPHPGGLDFTMTSLYWRLQGSFSGGQPAIALPVCLPLAVAAAFAVLWWRFDAFGWRGLLVLAVEMSLLLYFWLFAKRLVERYSRSELVLSPVDGPGIVGSMADEKRRSQLTS